VPGHGRQIVLAANESFSRRTRLTRLLGATGTRKSTPGLFRMYSNALSNNVLRTFHSDNVKIIPSLRIIRFLRFSAFNLPNKTVVNIITRKTYIYIFANSNNRKLHLGQKRFAFYVGCISYVMTMIISFVNFIYTRFQLVFIINIQYKSTYPIISFFPYVYKRSRRLYRNRRIAVLYYCFLN